VNDTTTKGATMNNVTIATDEYAALGQLVTVDGVKVGRVKKSDDGRAWRGIHDTHGGFRFSTKTKAVAWLVRVGA
jgi:hypothetical protein